MKDPIRTKIMYSDFETFGLVAFSYKNKNIGISKYEILI
jgi:hypothetical protein